MKVIDELIESARLAGSTQAKRGYGVYTQDDAIMERAFWEGVEARAKAIRDEVVALKAERDATMKDAERMREALSFYAEGAHLFFNKKEWDAVSGEPRNFWYDKAGTATVEDGTIAKFALSDTKAEGGAA